MNNTELKYYGKLIGKTVKSIAVDDANEYFGLIFNDDTVAWVLRDPEGNGPGYLDIENK